MQIEVKGRNLPVTDELREFVDAPLRQGRQAGQRAGGPRGRAVRGAQPGQPGQPGGRGDAPPQGTTLRARESSRDLKHSINLISDELARQVKRHRDKRRSRREARAATPIPPEGSQRRRGGAREAAAAW